MPELKRPYVDFQQAKCAVSVPDVLEAFGILDRFERKGYRLSGVCPLPQHQHSAFPNPQQFKAEVKEGLWLWHCFGDCQCGGDSIELARLLTGLDHAHLRLWLVERFGERLSTSKPRNGRSAPPPQPKEEARAVAQEPTRANVNTTAKTVDSDLPSIKPLKFRLKLDPSVPYLQVRGVHPETIGRYGLGLCSRGLLKGYVAIPVYRHPKEAADENPVAYLGRWPGDDFDEAAGRPRYKWPLDFPKQRFVYGLAEALETPADRPLIVVEGAFTVFHLVQQGFQSAVSIFGSSMSDEQAHLIGQTGRSVILFLDPDEAGEAGTRDAIVKLCPLALTRTVRTPRGLAISQMPHDELAALLNATS